MEKDICSLEDGLEMERKEWPILRIGWCLMGVFILLALFGFFGGGILSKRIVQVQGFSIEYDRFLRYSLGSEIVITANSLGSDSSIVINNDYVRKIKIDKITPEPAQMRVEGENLRLIFDSTEGRTIIFYISPFRKGNQKLTLKLNGIREEFSQFIYF